MNFELNQKVTNKTKTMIIYIYYSEMSIPHKVSIKYPSVNKNMNSITRGL